ncbi:unnamed protein product [Cylindrotheca closterium]|uniref:Uncharacterized protein n=1 Tax=Cylindrotheca closterium TaxID=2856 RepID=A0AAD2GD28_9STRA|nr:unnamed protein product [Cylindrotheca closterium]CAJ1970057.1 unnamed protein product [Cylindrotheca closterium]
MDHPYHHGSKDQRNAFDELELKDDPEIEAIESNVNLEMEGLRRAIAGCKSRGRKYQQSKNAAMERHASLTDEMQRYSRDFQVYLLRTKRMLALIEDNVGELDSDLRINQNEISELRNASEAKRQLSDAIDVMRRGRLYSNMSEDPPAAIHRLQYQDDAGRKQAPNGDNWGNPGAA